MFIITTTEDLVSKKIDGTSYDTVICFNKGENLCDISVLNHVKKMESDIIVLRTSLSDDLLEACRLKYGIDNVRVQATIKERHYPSVELLEKLLNGADIENSDTENSTEELLSNKMEQSSDSVVEDFDEALNKAFDEAFDEAFNEINEINDITKTVKEENINDSKNEANESDNKPEIVPEKKKRGRPKKDHEAVKAPEAHKRGRKPKIKPESSFMNPPLDDFMNEPVSDAEDTTESVSVFSNLNKAKRKKRVKKDIKGNRKAFLEQNYSGLTLEEDMQVITYIRSHENENINRLDEDQMFLLKKALYESTDPDIGFPALIETYFGKSVKDTIIEELKPLYQIIKRMISERD